MILKKGGVRLSFKYLNIYLKIVLYCCLSQFAFIIKCNNLCNLMIHNVKDAERGLYAQHQHVEGVIVCMLALWLPTFHMFWDWHQTGVCALLKALPWWERKWWTVPLCKGGQNSGQLCGCGPDIHEPCPSSPCPTTHWFSGPKRDWNISDPAKLDLSSKKGSNN